jgi:hypothetical protein
MENTQLAGIWVNLNSMNKSLSLNARSRRMRHIFQNNISEDSIPVLRIRSRIRIRRIWRDPSIIKQKLVRKTLIPTCSVTSLWLILKNDVASKSNKQRGLEKFFLFVFLKVTRYWRKYQDLEPDPGIDPDPYQNVTDAQHCSILSSLFWTFQGPNFKIAPSLLVRDTGNFQIDVRYCTTDIFERSSLFVWLDLQLWAKRRESGSSGSWRQTWRRCTLRYY